MAKNTTPCPLRQFCNTTSKSHKVGSKILVQHTKEARHRTLTALGRGDTKSPFAPKPATETSVQFDPENPGAFVEEALPLVDADETRVIRSDNFKQFNYRDMRHRMGVIANWGTQDDVEEILQLAWKEANLSDDEISEMAEKSTDKAFWIKSETQRSNEFENQVKMRKRTREDMQEFFS